MAYIPNQQKGKGKGKETGGKQSFKGKNGEKGKGPDQIFIQQQETENNDLIQTEWKPENHTEPSSDQQGEPANPLPKEPAPKSEHNQQVSEEWNSDIMQSEQDWEYYCSGGNLEDQGDWEGHDQHFHSIGHLRARKLSVD